MSDKEGYTSYINRKTESDYPFGPDEIHLREERDQPPLHVYGGNIHMVKQTENHLEKVMAERADRYGKFSDNARMSQIMKESFRAQPVWDNLSLDKRESLDNIAQKVARILTGKNANYKDSWTDIAGYATLVADTLVD